MRGSSTQERVRYSSQPPSGDFTAWSSLRARVTSFWMSLDSHQAAHDLNAASTYLVDSGTRHLSQS